MGERWQRRMRRLTGLALFGTAFWVAATAGAALAPTLAVSSDANQLSVVQYTQGAGDDPLAKLAIYVPSDYNPVVAFQVGVPVGRLTIVAAATDQGGASITFSGSLAAGLPTDAVTVGGVATTLGAAATACTGTASHTGILLASLSGGGQTWQVPVYVDQVQLGAPFSDTTSLILTICLPPPDVAAGTAGRAVLGAKPTSATFELPDFLAAAPGRYVWHAQATPFTPRAGTVNTAGAVEVESLDRTAPALTVKAVAKKTGKRTTGATVTGTLTAGGKPVGGAAVKIMAGTKAVGTAKTKASGAFTAVVRSTAKRLSASATVPTTTAGACQAPLFAPAPCVGLSAGGFTVKSTAVAVKQ